MLIVLAVSSGIIIQWLRTVAVKKGSVFYFLQYDIAFIVFWNDKLTHEYTVDFTVISLKWYGIMHTFWEFLDLQKVILFIINR